MSEAPRISEWNSSNGQ